MCTHAYIARGYKQTDGENWGGNGCCYSYNTRNALFTTVGIRVMTVAVRTWRTKFLWGPTIIINQSLTFPGACKVGRQHIITMDLGCPNNWTMTTVGVRIKAIYGSVYGVQSIIFDTNTKCLCTITYSRNNALGAASPPLHLRWLNVRPGLVACVRQTTSSFEWPFSTENLFAFANYSLRAN